MYDENQSKLSPSLIQTGIYYPSRYGINVSGAELFLIKLLFFLFRLGY